MARLNIEDSIYSDHRFLFVADSIGRFSAMGQMVYLMKLAQKFWAQGKLRIPTRIYEISGFSELFLESGMVDKNDDGYYLSGSEEHFSWLIAKIENGKKGGRPKSTSNKNNDVIKPNDNLNKANESYENPLTLTPTLTPTPTHNKYNTSKKAASVSFDFESVYKLYPKKEGKSKGMKKLKAQIKTQAQYENFTKAVKDYSSMCKREGKELRYIKQFYSFVGCWEDYLDEEVTGIKAKPVSNGKPANLPDVDTAAEQYLNRVRS